MIIDLTCLLRVECDRCETGEQVVFTGSTPYEARTAARDAGWRVDRRHVLCPTCAGEHGR